MVLQKGNAARRNLLAGLAIIPFGAAAYWISRPDEDEDEDAMDMLPFDDGQTAQLADRKPWLVWLSVQQSMAVYQSTSNIHHDAGHLVWALGKSTGFVPLQH